MQLYWHTKAPNYQPLSFIPENRIYLSRYRVDDFIKSYQKFSNGKVVDDSQQSSTVIGGEKIALFAWLICPRPSEKPASLSPMDI